MYQESENVSHLWYLSKIELIVEQSILRKYQCLREKTFPGKSTIFRKTIDENKIVYNITNNG